MSRYRGLSSG